jgi:hypothetical protein
MSVRLFFVLAFFSFGSSAPSQNQTPNKEIEKSLDILKKAKLFESRFFGEAGRVSEHHVAFERIIRSKNPLSHFKKLASFETNEIARVYGLLGIWKINKEEYDKIVLTGKLDKKISCMLTFGPAEIAMKKIFESPEKTWRVFLFDKKLK